MLYTEGSRLLRRYDEELLCIEPWGRNSLRVRATRGNALLANEDFALLPAAPIEPEIVINGTRASIVNGKLRCDVTPSGKLRFSRADTGEALLDLIEVHGPLHEAHRFTDKLLPGLLRLDGLRVVQEAPGDPYPQFASAVVL